VRLFVASGQLEREVAWTRPLADEADERLLPARTLGGPAVRRGGTGRRPRS
jgi:hypothetical protein